MTSNEPRNDDILAVVGIGASAGGLEALKEMVSAIPEDTGMCYVIVQHLAPDHPSIMDQLLSAHSMVPVIKIEDGMRAEPDMVYVIPSGPSLTISDGRFHLEARDPAPGVRTPIDKFLISLADERKESAACAILLGTGSDGTVGLRAGAVYTLDRCNGSGGGTREGGVDGCDAGSLPMVSA